MQAVKPIPNRDFFPGPIASKSSPSQLTFSCFLMSVITPTTAELVPIYTDEYILNLQHVYSYRKEEWIRFSAYAFNNVQFQLTKYKLKVKKTPEKETGQSYQQGSETVFTIVLLSKHVHFENHWSLE